MSQKTAESAPTGNQELLYAVDERPPQWIAASLGLQHVLMAFSGIVVIPVIVARGSDIPPEQIEYVAFASILVSAISTLIQVLRFGRIGSGYVLFMGTSGAFISASLAAANMGGFALVATMTLLAAPMEFLFAYLLRHLRHIVTPTVGGILIMLVSVNLLPIAMDLWSGYAGSPGHNSAENLAVGGITLTTILLLGIYGGPRLRLWCPLIGTAAGYAAAAALGLLDLAHTREAAWFGLPRGSWPGLALDLGAEHIPLLVTFLVTTLAGTIESVGAVIAIQRISERNPGKIDYERVQGGIYSDGLGNTLAGLAGTVPNTTYDGNVAIVELTGVGARAVGIWGAAWLAVLAFFPKLGAIVLDIPGPVLGGSLVVFVGMLFAIGMGLVASAGLTHQTTTVTGMSLCVGIAMENGLFFHDIIPPSLLPFLGNSIATGSLAAVFLTLMFRFRPWARRGLRLEADITQLPRLTEYVAQLEKSLSLSTRQAFRLQLACEESYAFFCSSSARGGSVRFQWSREGDSILTEIESRAPDLDPDRVPVHIDPATASREELENLGLAILQRLVSEFRTLKIDGYHFISFKIPRE